MGSKPTKRIKKYLTVEASSSPKGGDISSESIAVRVVGLVLKYLLGCARSKTWQMLVVRLAKVPGGGRL